MSAPSPTVLATWKLACPACQRDDQVDVQAHVDVRLTPQGSDPDLAQDGTHYWDSDHRAICRVCGFIGAVKTFER